MKDELVSLDIGTQVRKLRNRRDITLQNLADLTGISTANLSQSENNLVTPPIATLLKISSALGGAIGDFFKDSPRNSSIVVVRRQDRYGVAKGPHISHSGYQCEPPAYPGRDKRMGPFIVPMEERVAEVIVFSNPQRPRVRLPFA